jgi:hypothetical protein
MINSFNMLKFRKLEISFFSVFNGWYENFVYPTLQLFCICTLILINPAFSVCRYRLKRLLYFTRTVGFAPLAGYSATAGVG